MGEVLTATELELAQKNMQAYLKTHDTGYVADDAVFINMNTGERTVGKEAIGQMLHYIYHVAFDAKAETTGSIITADKAVVEGIFTGKHTGDFAGIPATGKMVSVPICVTYSLENGLIKEAKIYMLADVLMRQLQQ